MKFTLKQLEVFAAIAKFGTVVKAAEALSMSQSATSAALQELESRYDKRLFERKGKRLSLNAHGAQMRTHAEDLLHQAFAFDQAMREEPQGQQLSVGASYAIGNYLAFDYAASFAKVHPEISVDIAVGSTPDIVNKVLNYEVDLGLVEGEPSNDALDVEIWRADNMLVFCSPHHMLANIGTLTDQDILQHEWILREPGSGHRQTFDRAMQGILSKLKVRTVLTQNEAIKNAVRSGLGLGCLSEIAVREEIAAGTLTPLSLEGRPMNRYFYIVRRHGASLSHPEREWMVTIKSDQAVM